MNFDERPVEDSVISRPNKPVLIWILCAVALVLVVAGCVLFFTLRPERGNHNGLHIIFDFVDQKTIMYPIYNKQLISQPINMGTASSSGSGYNADRSAYYSLNADDKLYLVTPDSAKLFMSNVWEARFSKDGKSLFILCDGVSWDDRNEYFAPPYTLKRYDLETKRFHNIATDASRTFFQLDDGRILYIAYGGSGKNTLSVVEETGIRRIQEIKGNFYGYDSVNERVFLYEASISTNTAELACYDKDGSRTVLFSGKWEQHIIIFNRDYSQVLVSGFNHGSYICEFGKEPVKISNGFAEIVSPFTDVGYHKPIVEDFYGQIYRASRGESSFYYQGWLIDRDIEKSVQLTPTANFLSTDPSGDYLYYLHNGEFRIAKISDMADAHKNSVLITSDTDDFDNDLLPLEVDLTSDGSVLYYSSNFKLYSVDARRGGTPKLIASGLDKNMAQLKLSLDDILYYQSGGNLYRYDGKQGQLVMENIDSYSVGEFPYVIQDGGVYYLDPDGEPEYLFDLI